nr:amidase domain-containing protein [Bacilli bacterium]
MKKRSNGNKIVLIVLVILLVIAIFTYYKTESIINPKDNNVEEKTKKEDSKDNVEKEDNKKDESEENKNTTYTSSYLGTVTNNSGTEIKAGWQDVITKYLDLYTESLVKLESKDVKKLFTTSNGIEAHLINAIIDLKVEHHKLQKNDMSLSSAKYDIEYKNVSIDGNRVKIEFLEDDYYQFKFMKNESKIFDVETTIMLRKNNDSYTIDYVRSGRDNYVMFTDIIDTDKDSKTDIDKLKSKYITWIKDEVEENEILLEEANKKDYKSISCDHKYNRDAATDYAMKYADDRNNEYHDYSNDGGNCANYGSQTIYAGGIPMDIKGDYEWKYYGTGVDENNTKNGRSNSWTSTSYFYDYAKNNEGSGMCASTDVNLFYAEGGDIIQVGYSGYTHTTVVINKIMKDNKIIDISINSNTVGLENYPLLGYVYQNKRLIKILGYND